MKPWLLLFATLPFWGQDQSVRYDDHATQPPRMAASRAAAPIYDPPHAAASTNGLHLHELKTKTGTYVERASSSGGQQTKDPKSDSPPTLGVGRTDKTTPEPSRTSIDVTSINKILNPVMFSGADIGAKINTAMASTDCGIIEIPAGSYSFKTNVNPIPHCMHVRGQKSSTRLVWQGAGAAFTLSNVSDPGQYRQGSLEGFTLTGTRTFGQVGVYQGGDPLCKGACTVNPSSNVGYNYVMRDVTVYAMDNGIYWGNGAFNIEWDNVISTNNSKYGWYYPATSVGGGQNSHFYHSQLQGNGLGAFYIDQDPQVNFSMMGMDIEYNGSQSSPGNPKMRGGSYTCLDCHVEDNYGPFVEVPGNGQSAIFIGGSWILVGTSGRDADLARMEGGKASLLIDGTDLYIQHAITNLVSIPAGVETLTVSVKNLTLVDAAYNLKSVVSRNGPGISYCLPYDNSTGTGAGSCFDGNVYTNPIATRASSINPTTFRANSAYMSWNGDATSGGVDIYDTYSSPATATYAFRLNANISGVYTPVFSVSRNGFITAAGVNINHAAGFTGTKTAGSCTFEINGGIITGVSGC